VGGGGRGRFQGRTRRGRWTRRGGPEWKTIGASAVRGWVRERRRMKEEEKKATIGEKR